MLDEKAVQVINEILKKGHTVEIRKRKNEIVILEMQGKIKHAIAING